MILWYRVSRPAPASCAALAVWGTCLALPALAQTPDPASGRPATTAWTDRVADWADDRWQPSQRALDAGVQPGSAWSAQFSPGTWHANYKPEHAHSVAGGLRYARGPDDFVGFSLFRNSFGQPSAYALYGQRLYGGVPALPKFYVEWTAGLMYGYVGERAKEVPLNVRGFSPVFTLSPGWQITPQLSGQLNVIGSVAVMLQFDWRFR